MKRRKGQGGEEGEEEKRKKIRKKEEGTRRRTDTPLVRSGQLRSRLHAVQQAIGDETRRETGRWEAEEREGAKGVEGRRGIA